MEVVVKATVLIEEEVADRIGGLDLNGQSAFFRINIFEIKIVELVVAIAAGSCLLHNRSAIRLNLWCVIDGEDGDLKRLASGSPFVLVDFRFVELFSHGIHHETEVSCSIWCSLELKMSELGWGDVGRVDRNVIRQELGALIEVQTATAK